MKNLFLIFLSIFFICCNLPEEPKESFKNSSANTISSYTSNKTDSVQNIMTDNYGKSITKRTDVFECDELLELVENRRKQYPEDDRGNIDNKNQARAYKAREEVVKRILFNEYKADIVIETPQEKEKLAKICEAMRKYIDFPIKDL